MHPKPCADTSSPCEPSFILSTLPPIFNSLPFLQTINLHYYLLLPFSQAVEEEEEEEEDRNIYRYISYHMVLLLLLLLLLLPLLHQQIQTVLFRNYQNAGVRAYVFFGWLFPHSHLVRNYTGSWWSVSFAHHSIKKILFV